MYLDPIIASPQFVILPKKGTVVYRFGCTGEISCRLIISDMIKTISVKNKKPIFLVSGEVAVSWKELEALAVDLSKFKYNCFTGVIEDMQHKVIQSERPFFFRAFNTTNDLLCFMAANDEVRHNLWDIDFIFRGSCEDRVISNLGIGDGEELLQIAKTIYEGHNNK